MPDDPFVGKTLCGRFEVFELIGRGGMGAVYKARQTTIESIVAIKVMEQTAGGTAVIMRFRQEAQALSQLSHPNIIKVLAMDVQEGVCFIVMEYVQGKGLDQVIREQGCLSTDTLRKFFRQITAGLQHAHERGIVHRDLKPSNILVCDDGETIKLLDFGIAKLLNSDQKVTSTGAIMGTPNYMSPEQCGSGNVDARSDIYSLGCVIYQALTGELPFDGNTAWEVLCKQLTETLPLGLDPRLAPFAGVIAKATQKDPDKRYQTMGELAFAIQSGEKFEEQKARPKATLQPRHLIVSASLALVAIVGWFYYPQLAENRLSRPTELTISFLHHALTNKPTYLPSDSELKFAADTADRQHDSMACMVAAEMFRRKHDFASCTHYFRKSCYTDDPKTEELILIPRQLSSNGYQAQATELMKILIDRWPGSPFAIDLVSLYDDAGEPRQALAVLEKLRQCSPALTQSQSDDLDRQIETRRARLNKVQASAH